MRELLIVPIVHSRRDLGQLEPKATELKTALFGEVQVSISHEAIDRFWATLTDCICKWTLDFSKLAVFQDGLPHSESSPEIVHRIVHELADKGSANHLLLRILMKKGSVILGTESPQLLLKEYEAIRNALANQSLDEPRTNLKSLESQSLLDQRDEFIANRIASTLSSETLGLLFIGLNHHVEKFLPEDIRVSYPAGKPSLRRKSTVLTA